MNKWTLPLIVCSAALCAPAFADIGPKPRHTAPGAELTGKDYEDINVEMTSEDVKLVLSHPAKSHQSMLAVEVTFNMTNLGDATEFEIGFPVGQINNMSRFSATTDAEVQDFKLIERLADDKKAAPGRGGRDETPHDYWYVWQSKFGAKATHIHVVKYDLGISHFSEWRSAGYVLHTGAAWKNPIKKATVSLRCGDGLSLDNVFGLSPTSGCTVGKDNIQWVFENFDPTEKDDISIRFNTRHSWTKEVSNLRRDAATYWSAKCELVYRLSEAPARNARTTFTDAELADYCDAMIAVISELKEEEGKFVMPADDPVRIDTGEDEGEESAMSKAVRESMRNQRDTRSYGRKNESNQLILWFDRAFNTAKAYPKNAKALEMLGKYEAMLGYFLDGKLYAGTVKMELRGKSSEKRLEQLRTMHEEARTLLGVQAITTK